MYITRETTTAVPSDEKKHLFGLDNALHGGEIVGYTMIMWIQSRNPSQRRRPSESAEIKCLTLLVDLFLAWFFEQIFLGRGHFRAEDRGGWW